MSLEWKPDKAGDVIAAHERGDYRVSAQDDRYIVLLNGAVIAHSSNEDIAFDMAEEHAEFGFFAIPPRRRAHSTP